MDIIALEQHFSQELETCYDGIAGEGLQVRVDRGEDRRPLILQVFPETQIVRVWTGLTDMTLRHARVAPDSGTASLLVTGDSDEERARILLRIDGTVLFASFPGRLHMDESPGGADEAMAQERKEDGLPADELSEGSVREKRDEGPERVVDDTPEPAGTQEIAAPSPSTSELPNTIEQERITLTGRVGVEPRFRTTKNDKLVCSFPLAVHEEDGSTKWHDVVTFGERAIKLQDSLHKGHEIQIVGYVHTKQVPGKDGKPKDKREIWAAVVRRPKAP